MSAMGYLILTKTKAMVRNVFSKPLSAILTLIALGFFGFVIFFALNNKSMISMAQGVTNLEGMLTLFLGYAMLFLFMMLIQKRSALVYMNDANYIFAGPFTRKQILGYLLAETIRGSILIAVLSTGYMLMFMSGDLKLTIGFIIALFASGLLMFYFVFALNTYFYFKKMTSKHARTIQFIIMGGMIALVLLLLGFNIMQHGMDIKAGVSQFISDPLFYFIPIFGWIKWALISWAKAEWLFVVCGFGLSLAASIIVTWLILNIKGDFFEQAVNDAEYFTEMRSKMKSGKSDETSVNLKIKEVTSKGFASGAMALASKNILIARKTNTWLKKQEIFLLVMYMFIAYFANMNFQMYQYFMMIVIFISVSADGITQELRSHYSYLIPDKPMNKLIALVIPTLLRVLLVSVIAIVPAFLIFRSSVFEVLSGIITLFGYGTVFVAGSVWSIRLLKSRSNVFVEQFLRMGILILSIIPGIIVTVLVSMQLNDLSQIMAVSAIVSMLTNVIVGMLLLLSAKSIFKGSNVMAD